MFYFIIYKFNFFFFSEKSYNYNLSKSYCQFFLQDIAI